MEGDGFSKVLNDLKQQRTQKPSVGTGFLNSLQQFTDKQKDIQKNLENLPSKFEHFSVEELQSILEIRKKLDQFTNELEQLSKGNAGREKLLSYFSDTINFLDSIELWNSKFSTGTVNNLRDDDSIYYKTPSGISLRLKMALLEKDTKNVIQPFMENIAFDRGLYYPSKEPVLDTTPHEYCSDEFYALQKQEDVSTPFVSQIKQYYKNGDLYFVQKPEHLFHEHPGNPVNKIFFQK